jgi:hypothetical protein
VSGMTSSFLGYSGADAAPRRRWANGMAGDQCAGPRCQPRCGGRGYHSLSIPKILNVTLSLVSNECASQNYRIGASWREPASPCFRHAELSAQDGGLTTDFSMRVAHRHVGWTAMNSWAETLAWR